MPPIFRGTGATTQAGMEPLLRRLEQWRALDALTEALFGWLGFDG